MTGMAEIDSRDPRVGHEISALGPQDVYLAAEAPTAVTVQISLEDVVIVGEDDAGPVAEGVAPRPAERLPPSQRTQHGEIRGDLAGDAVSPVD